jgi:Asp-tRNA(Asn)/Glu-tRNA(Gln) amidotransferase C subunit
MRRDELDVTAELAMIALGPDERGRFEASVGQMLDFFSAMDAVARDSGHDNQYLSAPARRADKAEVGSADYVSTAIDLGRGGATPERPDIVLPFNNRNPADNPLSNILVNNAPETSGRYVVIPNVL